MTLLYLTILYVVLMLAEVVYMAIVRNRFHRLLSANTYGFNGRRSVTGGGFIFYPAIVSAAFASGLEEVAMVMVVGAAVLWIVSFIDDCHSLSVILRLIVQGAVTAVAMWWLAPGNWCFFAYAFIMGMVVVNAFNFMDGINGMLTMYSVVVLMSLLVVFLFLSTFTGSLYILPAALLVAVLVLGVFNVVRMDEVLSGDVGSIVMGFSVAWLMAVAMTVTGDYTVPVLVAVYIVDVLMTICRRIIARENIFSSHQTHLYQRLSSAGVVRHHRVALGYCGTQLVINTAWLLIPVGVHDVFAVAVFVVLLIAYAYVSAKIAH